MQIRSALLPQCAAVMLAAAIVAAAAGPVRAQDTPGCCEYVTRVFDGTFTVKQRACAIVAPADCRAVAGRFFPRLRCDPDIVACTRGAPAGRLTATPTATPSPTPQAAPAVTATPGSPSDLGCCQLSRSDEAPLCEDSISRAQCLGLFDGQTTFCAGCVCSGRQGPRLDFNQGTCVPGSTPRTRLRPPRPPRPVRPVHPSRLH